MTSNDTTRARIRRWAGPAIVSALLTAATWVGMTAWAHHNAQHAQADADHQLLIQVVQVLNRQLAQTVTK